MTPNETSARSLLDSFWESMREWDAKADERHRLKVKSDLAIERLHRAVADLVAALPES
jgi:hypothetical protein